VKETESGLIFSPREKLVAGSTAKMDISYQGLTFPAEEAFGLFQNPYKKEDGSAGMFFLTQLEMDGARRIFPCLDDPSLKANFTVSLISAESHTCLSNMDVDTVSQVAGGKKVTFNTSPPMSTYLLALAVGDLNFIESTDFRVPIRVHGSPARNMETAKYVLGVAVEGMKRLEEVLGVEYALPKIDHVAVEGGSFGGMENWGLITLDRSMVFLDDNAPPETRQLTAEIVLHELAHMWFGDLVTMDWWTHIWLNEGL
jgi:aminopeptidase 2